MDDTTFFLLYVYSVRMNEMDIMIGIVLIVSEGVGFVV